MMRKSQFAPLDIAIILIVIFFGMFLLIFLPTHLIERDLALSIKVYYTSNEANLALLDILLYNYKGEPIYYLLASESDVIGTVDFKNYLTNFLNKTLSYKLICYNLEFNGQRKISYGKCNRYDYQAEYPIFLLSATKIGEVKLMYNKEIKKIK